MKLSKFAIILLPLLLIVGCARYVAPPSAYNVNNAQVLTKSAHPTVAEVGKAISLAGTGLGWKMDQARPGYTVATLNIRSHQAKVGITYNTHNYSIKYISSQNLTSSNGNIHKNYSGWIQNLNRAIQSHLAIV